MLERTIVKIAGPIREVSLNDPRAVPPEEILSAIYAPISQWFMSGNF